MLEEEGVEGSSSRTHTHKCIHTHAHTRLPSVKCMEEALRHTACVCRLHGCLAQRSNGERKIGGGEWLHRESRRREERREGGRGGQFPFCNTHATRSHREKTERAKKIIGERKRESEREREGNTADPPSVRPSVRQLCLFCGAEVVLFFPVHADFAD